MASYNYKAATLDGRIVEGVIEAGDDRIVANKIQDMGYIPIKIGTEEKKAPVIKKLALPKRAKKINNKDLLVFTQELLTLTKSGLPLDRSLLILSRLSEKEALKEIVQGVLKEIKGGKSLSEALAEYPKVFPNLYVNMVRAGEAGGVLDQVLSRLITFLESKEELKTYFISALIYPAFLTLAGSASIAVLLLFVIPRFAKIFTDSGIPMPLTMQIMLGLSNFISGYWWLILGVVLLAVVWFRRYIGTEEGRIKWDRKKLRLPVLGPTIQKFEVAIFTRTLGTLLHSAVPLLQAMTIVKEVVGNKAIASTMDSIKSGVKKGEGLATPLKESGIFPPLALHLLEVGEESGKLDTMLLQIADAYDRDIKASIKKLISLFEPVMILVMALVIAVMVVSMLTAIFSIYDVPL